MEITKTTAGILTAICITAAGGGAYLGLRSSGPATPAATPEPLGLSSDPGAVDQSEGVIPEAPATDAVTPAPTRPAPAPTVAAPTRRPNRPVGPARASRVPAAPARAETAAPVAEPVASGTSARETTREPVAPAPEPARRADIEPSRPVEPPAPQFEDLVLSTESVIGLHLETAVSSERARVEDEVLASVTRDVRVGDRVAIPAGSKAHGEVTLVERGGKLRDRARLGIRFTSIVLGDGTRVALETDTIYREGESPAGESAAKIGGGAIGGAILGGIFGGAKGAILGGSAGAGAGTAVVAAGGRNPATLPTGAPVTVRLLKPATVTVEK